MSENSFKTKTFHYLYRASKVRKCVDARLLFDFSLVTIATITAVIKTRAATLFVLLMLADLRLRWR